MKSTPSFETSQVDEFHQSYVIDSQPTKIAGLSQHMPAYKKWNFEYFQKIGNDIEVGLSDDPLKRGRPTSYATLSHYCKEVEDCATSLYMVGWAFEDEKPDLLSDFILPPQQPKDFIDDLIPSVRFRRKWIFIGRENLFSDLHVDAFTTNAWLMVITGQKTVRFLSPLYQSHVTPEDSLFDEKLLSRLESEGIEVFEMNLMPGDIGYVPSGWMHHVRNDTNNIMVTGNFSHGHDVIRFYPNFRALLDRDVRLCDDAYENHLNDLAGKPTSLEHHLAVQYEISRLEKLQIDIHSKLAKLRGKSDLFLD